jgi:hypothetical protein
VEKKTIIVNVNTDEGVKSLNRLESSFEDVYGEVQPLTGRIGELEDQLYEMATAGQQGTKEFNDLAATIGRMKKVILDVDMQVDGLSMSFTNKLGGSIQGVAAGFELVQGAFGAFGAESKAVEEALLKVQSAMAISQGIQGIREAVPVFKALQAAVATTAIGQKALNVAQAAGAVGMRVLNAVMSANPIMLIITGITALIGAFAFFSRETETAAEANEKLNKSIERQNQLFEDNTNRVRKSADNRRRIMEAQGASEEELHQDTLRRLKEEEKLRIESLNNTSKNIVQRRQMYKKALEEEDYELAKEIRQQIEADRAKYKELKLNRDEFEIATLEENSRYNSKVSDDDRAAEEKRLADWKNIQEKKKQEQERIRAEERKFAFEQYQLMNDIEALQREQDKKREEDFLESLLIMPDIMQTQGDQLVEITEETFSRMDFVQTNWKDNFKKTFDTTIGFAGDALGAIQDLTDAFEGKSEASQRRAFKVRKAAAIAQTTIETYKAAQGAYASQIIPGDPTSPIRGAIAATIAVASGLAKVKSIASQQFESGGSASGGGGSSTPSLPQSNPATFNIVGNSGTNQIIEGMNANPVQAYVVSSDVTTAQSLDRNRIKTATF